MSKKKTEAAEQMAETAESVTENTENVTETAENASAAADKKIYVGASLPGMKTNTVIKGTIPEKYNVPYVRDLFIPEDKFTEFLKKKSVTGSYEAFCYRKSAELAQSLNK